MEERTRLKEHLQSVNANEENLLNRIKCLEAEEGYAHAEVNLHALLTPEVLLTIDLI